jgi:hypothetical protein
VPSHWAGPISASFQISKPSPTVWVEGEPVATYSISSRGGTLDVGRVFEHWGEIRVGRMLEEALADFDGSVLVVSHDRYFLDRICDQIVAFEEKPTYHFSVSMGVYVMSRRLLEIVPDDQFFGFDHLMHACIREKRKAILYPHRGYWLDIGRPTDYAEANEKIDLLMKRIFPEGDVR